MIVGVLAVILGILALANPFAASITATFAYQGNLQFPRVVEELYMVTRHEAFIFHFECFQLYAAKLSNDVNHFYKTFRPRPRRSVTLPKALPSSTTITSLPSSSRGSKSRGK